ncbi:hypothetical protein EFQ99_25345 [Rhizobium vallis]|uniref:DUF1795 domain-containing protein n=1 Tax=Rhizobium vallis TaxID=634290 RepID=A0A432PEY3_9HYPH|nr:hypothetical protein [Rhizobium vallis]RUM22217.1 hypothetical protein EFQ99_25345 [Rhizobium vallis]
MITRRSALIILASAVLPGGACAQNQPPGGDGIPEPLAFGIAQLPSGSDANVLALMASYGEGDNETKFVIELQSESHGVFRHVPGSHPVRFFEELGKALIASAPRLSDEKQETLPFDTAFLGPPTIRNPGGGYGGAPGDWYTTKLFLGQDQSEVYFNFNLVSGEAEFSIKDEDYGNAVLSELSKVIW